MQYRDTADVQRKDNGYQYEANAAHVAGGILHATVMRFKTFDGTRRYYGTARRVAWPLADLHVAWQGEEAEWNEVAA